MSGPPPATKATFPTEQLSDGPIAHRESGFYN